MAPTLFDELKMVTGQKKEKNEDCSSECCNFSFHLPDLKHIEKNIKMVTGIK